MAHLNLSYITGQSPTAVLYLNAVVVGQPIAMTEVGTTGEYFGNLPAGVAAGTYLVVFNSSGAKVASGCIEWDGAAEVLHATRTQVQQLGQPLQASSYAAPDNAAIATSVRTNLATELARMDAAISTRSTLAAGAEMTLTPAYAAAKTAATQTSVSAIPTNPVLANDTRLNNLDAAISTRSTLAAGDLPTAGLTPAQADQLTKVAHLHGVGATLVVTETTRQAGDVVQSVVTEGYTTTVTEV